MSVFKLNEEIFNSIRNDAIKKRYLIGDLNPELDYDEIDYDRVREIQNSAYVLHVDEDLDLLYIIDENGEREYIPEMIDGFTSSNTWLSDYIPEVSFDITQGGNVRKASEVIALFKTVWVCSILGEEFEDLISDVIGVDGNNYDFDKMVGKDGNTFKLSLEELQKIGTTLVRGLLSACSYKLNCAKDKKDSSFIKLLSEDERKGVEALKNLLVSEIVKYDKLIKEQRDAGESNLTLAKTLNEKYLEMQKIKKREEFAEVLTIFDISKLKSGNIGTIALRKLEKFSVKSAIQTAKDEGVEDLEQVKFYQNKIFRRLKSEKIRELRRLEFKKFKDSPADYKLPSKVPSQLY